MRFIFLDNVQILYKPNLDIWQTLHGSYKMKPLANKEACFSNAENKIKIPA